MTKVTPLEAIRAKCLDCVYNASEVKACVSTNCPLHPFRFGKNSFIKRELTEEQKAAAIERMKKAREARSK